MVGIGGGLGFLGGRYILIEERTDLADWLRLYDSSRLDPEPAVPE